MIRTLCTSLCSFLILLSSLAADEPSRKAESKIVGDIVYGHKDGLALTMDRYDPDGEANGGAVLFMMSGGWFSKWAPPEQTRPLFAPYIAKGFKVFCIRHGSSPRYSIPDAVSDVRQAVRFVRMNAESFAVDPNRLGAFGMSAGGHLALMLGTSGDDGDPDAKDPLKRVSSRVAAVAALVPPTDLRVVVWESPDTLPAYKNFPALNLEMEKAGPHSPLTHVTADDAPALVIMGGKDELVPKRHGEWIAEAFERAGVAHKLIIFPESGHGLEAGKDQAEAVGEVAGWFENYLAKKR